MESPEKGCLSGAGRQYWVDAWLGFLETGRSPCRRCPSQAIVAQSDEAI
jgi:hypothetical protein